MLEQSWVPAAPNSSLYIRPAMIGTEPTLGLGPANQATLFVILSPVGAYFGSEIKPVSLLCDPRYVRATPGGCGYTKMGANYAPTLWVQKVSETDTVTLHSALMFYFRKRSWRAASKSSGCSGRSRR